MEFIVWKEAYSVFHEQLDNDHRKIIEIINSLFRAMREEEEGKTLQKILVELSEYTRTHFAREEAVMRDLDYPKLHEHGAAHDRLSQRTEELVVRYQHGGERLSQEVLTLLKGWWINHILNMDRGYVPFITRQLGLDPLTKK